jgi:hypothetical protein
LDFMEFSFERGMGKQILRGVTEEVRLLSHTGTRVIAPALQPLGICYGDFRLAAD